MSRSEPVRVGQVYRFKNGVHGRVTTLSGRGRNASAWMTNRGDGYAGWIGYSQLRSQAELVKVSSVWAELVRTELLLSSQLVSVLNAARGEEDLSPFVERLLRGTREVREYQRKMGLEFLERRPRGRPEQKGIGS